METPTPAEPTAESTAQREAPSYLDALNDAQRAAVEHGIPHRAPDGLPDGLPHGLPHNEASTDRVGEGSCGTEPVGTSACQPMLVIAGAGSGKTNTLAHRVAHLIQNGTDPRRILLLTFTRRAAQEMTRRAQQIVAQARAEEARKLDGTIDPWDAPSKSRDGALRWSGTFHGIGNRLLRLYSDSAALDPAFTVLDRSDAADLMDWLRGELGLAKRERRFPKKGTCLAIYSHAVNAQGDLSATLEQAYPWCADQEEELRALFAAYVEAKQSRSVLDYDDLLLYWSVLMEDPAIARDVGERFDHVLVDEYQDTNRLQSKILLGMKPDGAGLTVVGDDAQSIYSFRAADVRNILDFPELFARPVRVVALEHNYRSVQPILEACNAVISRATERFTKNLYSTRSSQQKPLLVSVGHEAAQVDYVIERVLALREDGIPLKKQAVLFRSGHHSDALEIELGRRRIPFVKFGGLKFLEAAHVKDLLCILRWVENPRDAVAAYRVLQLLPGIGPAAARRIFGNLEGKGFRFETLCAQRIPAAAAEQWPGLCETLEALRGSETPWAGQVERARSWYQPQLERIHDAPQMRAADLDQMEQIAGTYPTRERFLSELTLDPPDASGDEAGDPHLDEDYLVLSTIHSAKGQEWDGVTVLNVVDGCIPSDMATKNEAQIEEERRLLYVAMTRAREHLALMQPLRFYVHNQPRRGDRHLYAPRSRFLPDAVLGCFERVSHGVAGSADAGRGRPRLAARVDVAARMRSMWSS